MFALLCNQMTLMFIQFLSALGQPWDSLGTALGQSWDSFGTAWGQPGDSLGTAKCNCFKMICLGTCRWFPESLLKVQSP